MEEAVAATIAGEEEVAEAITGFEEAITGKNIIGSIGNISLCVSIRFSDITIDHGHGVISKAGTQVSAFFLVWVDYFFNFG